MDMWSLCSPHLQLVVNYSPARRPIDILLPVCVAHKSIPSGRVQTLLSRHISRGVTDDAFLSTAKRPA